MSQQAQQSQTKQSSKGTGLSAPVAIQKDNLNNVENFIRKFNITKSTSKQEITGKLAQDIINSIIERALKNGKISIENGKYSIGGIENLSKQELIKIIAKKFKEEIQEMIINMYKNINLVFDRNEKENERKQNLQQINQLQKEIKTLEKSKKQLNNTLQRQKKDLLEATYKQARVESQIRTEIAQQEFQKTNAQLTGQGLMQGLDQLKQGIKGQILQAMSQQQTANIQIGQASQQSKAAELNMAKFLTQTALDEERNKIAHDRLQVARDANKIFGDQLKASRKLNDLTQKGLEQNIELRNTMVDGFNNINKALGNNTDTLIAATNAQLDAQEKTREALNLNTQAIDAANTANLDAQAKTTDAINKLSDQLGSDMRDLNNKVASLGDGLQKVGDKIGDLQDKLKKADPEKIKKIVASLGNCPYGYTYVHTDYDYTTGLSGWRCSGGQHFVSDADVAKRL